MPSRPWQSAWQQALYGPEGFYRRPEGPAGHFATTAQGSGAGVQQLLADAVVTLASRHRLRHIVEIGAGRGELLSAIAATAPQLRLTGVEVVDRPAILPESIEWETSGGGSSLPDSLHNLEALVLGHEWLDVVPCPVVRRDRNGKWRHVDVDPAGTESLGDLVHGADLDWLRSWVPPEVRTAEVGRPRDEAAAALVDRVRHGVVLLVDYGHTKADRPPEGTLTGYRDGRQVPPLPDGSTDVTAHVAVDSLGADELRRQRAVLPTLVQVAGAEPADAVADPAGYLAALGRRSALAAATAAGGLGDFWWAIWHLPPDA